MAAWVYRPPIDDVVRAFKFRGLEFLATDLAAGLVASLGARGWARGWARPLDAVVPVPLHWRRRLTRGFNQAESLAHPVARALGVPLSRLLRRARATPAQASLGRQERLVGPLGAFRPRRLGQVRGARLLLIDDVATTGATLESAARALGEAGALEVFAAVAARTP